MIKSIRLLSIVAIIIPLSGIARHANTAPLGLSNNENGSYPLSAPSIYNNPSTTFRTTIGFDIYDVDAGSTVELYRSLDATTGYQLIATISPLEPYEYVDRNLKPRTTFHYKARAVRGTEVSDYGGVFSMTTQSEFYSPEFTAVASEDRIELTIVDKSYQDQSYQIERADDGYYNGTESLDSGQTYVFHDNNVAPNQTYSYTLYATLMDEGWPTTDVATITVTTPLSVPGFDFPTSQYPDQTDIVFGTYNNNPGSITEIWRSFSSDSGYELVGTLPAEEHDFFDRNLRPRTDYYYKLRAAIDGQYSEFSEPGHFRTLSKNYPPTFTSRAIDEHAVELTLTDNSYNDVMYEVRGTSPGNGFYQEVYFPTDSGGTQTIVHEPVQSGTLYSYRVDMHYLGEGAPVHEGIATTEVTTPGTPSCSGSGSIMREVWTDVAGTDVTAIPLHEHPDDSRPITLFEAPSNQGSNYGARIKGYICVPLSGNYTFWIASDDKSVLYLSTDDTSGKKVKIAEVRAYTASRQWDRYTSQKSAPVALEAGRLYYIEALHKEATGGDHLAVGWQLPDGTLERPIPGNRLVPYQPLDNKPPVLTLNAPQDGDTFSAPATINFMADASDPDGSVLQVAFYHQGSKIGEDATAPYTFEWSRVPEGEYVVHVIATDDGGAQVNTSVTFTVEAEFCTGAGAIAREVWHNITGTDISSIPVNSPPSAVYTYSTFETPRYFANNYGSRMRGYVCVPQSGNYTFWLASDDQSQLWLSTDDLPANKQMIASVTGYTAFRDYYKYATQQSAPVTLEAGRRYYIEVLHKEANGDDHISVGWMLPDGILERPIPGSRLIAFEDMSSTLASARTKAEEASIGEGMGGNSFELFPNPVEHGEVTLAIPNHDGLWDEANIEVVSMTGKIVHQQRLDCGAGCQEVSLKFNDSATPGIYLVNVLKGERRLWKKMMIR